MRPLFLALACLLLLAACARPVVQKELLAPASASDVARLTRLRVLPFENDPGGRVRAAVENALTAISIDGRPYFAIIASSASGGPGAPAKDLGLPMQWSAPAKAKGQPIRYGAEGSVEGVVNRDGWHDERYQEQRSQCIAEDRHGKCLAWGNIPVQCVRRTAQFSFTPRVVAQDTGLVLLAQEFSETEQSSACLDKGTPASGSALLASASQRAVTRFRNQVAPHTVLLKIPLLAEDDSAMSPQTKTLVSGGVEFAQAGQTDKACRLWRAAAEGHPAGYALPYLAGVCAELEDRLDAAEGLYLEAEQRSHGPVPEIAEALTRIRSTRADQDRLENQRK